MRPIRRIIVHHSASPNDTTVEQLRQWHLDRGFTDIGYHYIITGDGRVSGGRPDVKIGAHCLGSNLGSLGICVTGDNTKPEHAWRGPQWVQLLLLIERLKAKYPAIDSVIGHRDAPGAKTLCPGLDLVPILTAENPLRAAGVGVQG